MHYAIVGNGVCGMEAALALRAREAEARITLVSDEHDHFFSRPALMYVFAGQTTPPRHRALRPRALRADALRACAQAGGLGRRPGRTRSSSRTARASRYDRLLLAMGSKGPAGSLAGGGGPGPSLLRHPARSRGPRPRGAKGQRAVVVGGGLIGVEVAEILHDRGLHVTFVVRENWYFPLALDSSEAALVTEHMRGTGHRRPPGSQRRGDSPWRATAGSGASRLAGRGAAGRPRGVRHRRRAQHGLSRRLRASLSRRAAPSRWTTRCDASAPDVWAAGDCANVTWADGSRRPEQLWYTARDQGRVGGPRRCSATTSPTAGAPGTTRPSSSTSSGRPRVGCRSASNWDNTPLDPGADVRSWFQRVPGQFVSQRIVVQGRPRGRLQHARLAAGTTSRSCDGSTSAGASTGCWSTCTRPSSTRSSCRSSASCPRRRSA